MKNVRHIYVASLLIALVITVSSCSSTQNFAGDYPKNNITGHGIGGHAEYIWSKTTGYPSTVAPVTAVATVEECPQPDASTLTADATVKETRGDKFVNKLTKFAIKQTGINNLADLTSADNSTMNKGMFNWRAKLATKLYSKIYSKYAPDERRGGGGLAGASRGLAITSIVTGAVSLVAYYGSFFLAVVAIVTGALALVGINRGGDGRRGLAIGGIVMGVVAIALWVLLFGIVIVVRF